MKAVLTAPIAALVALSCPVPHAVADPDAGGGAADPPAPAPPYIDHTLWAQWQGRSSLRVFPSPAGRAASRIPATTAPADEAWAEVLALSPDADTAGMRAQFLCHWQFAELAQPGKVSWNLEPWRPVVDDTEMVASGCNPGGPEESF
ncbi:DUF2599 domain-containing protein [Mycobacterium colombiense]|uniref:DUF2599 domain-containing protein n=1 Tax=Mycobacterium colombiense TaxID=339268 RepID=A0A853LZ07_9MYCO|nr:DUF2599 domain-containing protein [Mycobacterium colombiense]OBJ15343.1 hypothetical protein A5623_19905 [Mycobacterium colombiense]OBJ59246.1 hypothetical protein A5628_12145 [Mycobacterium colombiense]